MSAAGRQQSRAGAAHGPGAGSACELCQGDGGTVIWRDGALRVILVGDRDYPGFLRVVWNAHVREMCDLDAQSRDHLMAVVFRVENAVRAALDPDKINLASLGNATPHLHWHVIPRYVNDAHFPGPVWGVRQREPDAAALARQRAALPGLRGLIECAMRAK